MGLYEELRRIFLEPDVSKRSSKPPQKDKYVVIKHNGRKKVYRVNKYGELFEQKQ